MWDVLHTRLCWGKKLNLGKAKIFQKIPIVGLVMSDSYWLKAHLCLVCRRSSVRCQTTTIASYCGAFEISRPIGFVPMSANWSAALILTIASIKLGLLQEDVKLWWLGRRCEPMRSVLFPALLWWVAVAVLTFPCIEPNHRINTGSIQVKKKVAGTFP